MLVVVSSSVGLICFSCGWMGLWVSGGKESTEALCPAPHDPSVTLTSWRWWFVRFLPQFSHPFYQALGHPVLPQCVGVSAISWWAQWLQDYLESCRGLSFIHSFISLGVD